MIHENHDEDKSALVEVMSRCNQGKVRYLRQYRLRSTASSRHYSGVIMRAMASQITSLTIVYSTIYSGADQRKRQSSASLAFVRGIHRWPVNYPNKGRVTQKLYPFNDAIMGNQTGELFTHSPVIFLTFVSSYPTYGILPVSRSCFDGCLKWITMISISAKNITLLHVNLWYHRCALMYLSITTPLS